MATTRSTLIKARCRIMTEVSTRLNHALDVHSHWILVDGALFSNVRAIKLIWRTKGNTIVEALSLPQENVVKVKSLCLKAKVTRTMPARQIASVLGTLESCRPAIWQAPLFSQYLQIRIIQALHSSNQNFDVLIPLDHNINSVNGSPIRPPAPTLFITTEALRQDVAQSAKVNAQTGVGQTANAPST